ncbi:unnamed protein product, partial [Amoebophrya sp. A120]|eukprot:GSA120T00012850001.1
MKMTRSTGTRFVPSSAPRAVARLRGFHQKNPPSSSRSRSEKHAETH